MRLACLELLPELQKWQQKRQADYLLAVQQGYVENYLPLARFFAEAILRREVES